MANLFRRGRHHARNNGNRSNFGASHWYAQWLGVAGTGCDCYFYFEPGVTRVANHCDRTSLGLILLLCRPNGAAPHQSTRAPPHRGDLAVFAELPSGVIEILKRMKGQSLFDLAPPP